VAQTIDAYNRSDRLVIAILPEGTRAKVDTWKTEFYYIALGAKIPIALAFMDYKRKAGGILSTFSPTGDAEKDIAEIRLCYAGNSGRHADKSTSGSIHT
jgi:1-acyl-sn-glycerol-3-phosphate acyltransferase